MDQETTEKKRYELAFLLESIEAEDELIKMCVAQGAEALGEGAASLVQLSYPIRKKSSAFFGSITFSALPGQIRGLSQALSRLPRVLRTLVVASPEQVIPARVPGSPRPPEAKPIPPLRPAALSNEALEAKLEEILK